MKESDLAILIGVNTHDPECYDVRVAELWEARKRLIADEITLDVDLITYSWSVRIAPQQAPLHTVPIGEECKFCLVGASSRSTDYVIGIYDRTRPGHLNAMVGAVRQADDSVSRRADSS